MRRFILVAALATALATTGVAQQPKIAPEIQPDAAKKLDGDLAKIQAEVKAKAADIAKVKLPDRIEIAKWDNILVAISETKPKIESLRKARDQILKTVDEAANQAKPIKTRAAKIGDGFLSLEVKARTNQAHLAKMEGVPKRLIDQMSKEADTYRVSAKVANDLGHYFEAEFAKVKNDIFALRLMGEMLDRFDEAIGFYEELGKLGKENAEAMTKMVEIAESVNEILESFSSFNTRFSAIMTEPGVKKQ